MHLVFVQTFRFLDCQKVAYDRQIAFANALYLKLEKAGRRMLSHHARKSFELILVFDCHFEIFIFGK